MIKYFNELENPNEFKVFMIEYNSFNHVTKEIKLDFYVKYKKLFEYIKEINNLLELRLLKETCGIIDDEKRYLKQIEIVNLIKSNYILKKEYDYDTICDLYNLLTNDKYKKILKLVMKFDNLSTNELKEVLLFYKNFIDITNTYNKEIVSLFNLAIDEIKRENSIIYNKEHQTITLPSFWYILPKFHELEERLYNTTGENGHKEANLIYPYFKALDGCLIDYKKFIDKVKEIEKDGVSLADYYTFVRYKIGYFPNLLTLNTPTYEVKSHIKNNILVTTGCIMAQGLLWEFFNNLNMHTNNYKEALDKLRNVTLDDFLIRFVGFHKVIIWNDKRIISTSSLNYEEEFSEYKKRGWDIDFTKPLVFNYSNSNIEEVNNEIVKIKQFHID